MEKGFSTYLIVRIENKPPGSERRVKFHPLNSPFLAAPLSLGPTDALICLEGNVRCSLVTKVSDFLPLLHYMRIHKYFRNLRIMHFLRPEWRPSDSDCLRDFITLCQSAKLQKGLSNVPNRTSHYPRAPRVAILVYE